MNPQNLLKISAIAFGCAPSLDIIFRIYCTYTPVGVPVGQAPHLTTSHFDGAGFGRGQSQHPTDDSVVRQPAHRTVLQISGRGFGGGQSQHLERSVVLLAFTTCTINMAKIAEKMTNNFILI